MGNIMRVLLRDLKRLAKAPAAWAVALFLIVLPSLYAWINVYGFWNPYDNTGNLRVCVVNEDAGYDDDTLGQLRLGDDIVAELKDDDQLGWAFVDRDEAVREVSAGEAYAAFVVPDTFSADIASLLSGDLEQAKIEYFVNEKVGPVAPKIMDTGATELDTQINSTFVSEVAAAVSSALDEEVADLEAQVGAAARSASSRVGEAAHTVEDARDTISRLDGATQDAQGESARARESLAAGKQALEDLSDSLDEAADLVEQANLSAGRIALSLSGALDSSSAALSLSMAQANTAIGQSAATVAAARADVDGAARNLEAIVQQQDEMISSLEDLAKALPEGDARTAVLEALEPLVQANGEAKQLLEDLTALSADIDASASDIAAASDALNTATQDALSIGSAYRGGLDDSTLPTVSDGIASLANAISRLSGNVGSQTAVVDRATATLSLLETTLGQSSEAFAQTDALLADAADDLSSLQADLAALNSADVLGDLDGQSLDSQRIAGFMLSPTQVQTEQLYPLNSYGSAMAPLFINLTLWIGVFMLMVIMRIEVDREGVEEATVAQRYLGRQALLGLMCTAQAVVCCIGCLIIGVEVASAAMFVLTAIITSLSYLAIQYSLSSTFQHVGKALCLILVFVQIPGATGLYPIEMTTDFFRGVYPLFPFTYGINAIRETVFGFYGNLWIADVAVLLCFLAAFTIIGALGRPVTANLNRMFERQIRETDLANIERVELPDRRYRISQLLNVLYSREEYRHEMNVRVRKFMRAYPHLKRLAILAGMGVPIISTPILMMTGIDKVVILTIWLLWLIAVITFLIVIEYILDNMLHQLSLADVSADDITDYFSSGSGKDTGRRRRVADRRRRSAADGGAGREAGAHGRREPASAEDMRGKPASDDAGGDDGDGTDRGRHAAGGRGVGR